MWSHRARFSRAFDKLAHPILSTKLLAIGACGKLHTWLINFLIQYVTYQGTVSSPARDTSSARATAVYNLAVVVSTTHKFSVVQPTNFEPLINSGLLRSLDYSCAVHIHIDMMSAALLLKTYSNRNEKFLVWLFKAYVQPTLECAYLMCPLNSHMTLKTFGVVHKTHMSSHVVTWPTRKDVWRATWISAEGVVGNTAKTSWSTCRV